MGAGGCKTNVQSGSPSSECRLSSRPGSATALSHSSAHRGRLVVGLPASSSTSAADPRASGGARPACPRAEEGPCERGSNEGTPVRLSVPLRPSLEQPLSDEEEHSGAKRFELSRFPRCRLPARDRGVRRRRRSEASSGRCSQCPHASPFSSPVSSSSPCPAPCPVPACGCASLPSGRGLELTLESTLEEESEPEVLEAVLEPELEPELASTLREAASRGALFEGAS